MIDRDSHHACTSWRRRNNRRRCYCWLEIWAKKLKTRLLVFLVFVFLGGPDRQTGGRGEGDGRSVISESSWRTRATFRGVCAPIPSTVPLCQGVISVGAVDANGSNTDSSDVRLVESEHFPFLSGWVASRRHQPQVGFRSERRLDRPRLAKGGDR